MEVPEQLRNDAFRFVKLRRTDKRPVSGESWKDNIGTWQDAVIWLAQEFNVGVVGGYGRLQLLDIDKSGVEQGMADKVLALTGATLATATPGSGVHLYFLSDFKGNKNFGMDIGEWRGDNLYCVIAGCKLADDKTYRVFCDGQISEIDRKMVERIFDLFKVQMPAEKGTLVPSPFTKPKVVPDFLDKLITEGVNDGDRNRSRFIIMKELYNRGFTPEEIWTLLMTFNDNCRPDENESIVRTHYDYLMSHAEQYLHDLVDKDWLALHDYGTMTKTEKKTLIALSGKELAEKDIPEPEWLIEKLVPSVGLTVLSARGKSYKTMVAIRMASAVARGEDLFGLKVKQGRVLYFDAEIGPSEYKRRKTMIENGMDSGVLDDIYSVFAVENDDKIPRIDTLKGMEMVEATIDKYNPKLVIFDVLRRFHRIREDKADDVSAFYADFLAPLIAKRNLSVLCVFHNRKRGQEQKKISPFDIDPLDLMDEMRSSSEWPNIADSIILLQRFGKGSPFFALFSVPRRCEGIEKYVDAEWDDDSQKMTFYEVDRENIENAQAVEDNSRLEKVFEWLKDKTEFTTSQLKTIFIPKLFDIQIKRIIDSLIDSGKVKKKSRGEYNVINVINSQLGEYNNSNNISNIETQ